MTPAAGFTKLRFRRENGTEYPAWKHVAVRDVFDKVREKNADMSNENVITNSAEYGLIPQRDFFDKDIAVEGKTDNYTVIQTGDFVYNPRKSKQAPYGPFNCYKLPEDGIVSPLYTCLRPKGNFDSEYLLRYFLTPSWHRYIYENGAQGGARHDRVGMTDELMAGIPIYYPSDADEQRKIADFLTTVDERITASKDELAALQTAKKGLMQKIFSQELRFKQDDGTEYPKWEEKAFSDVFSLLGNNTLSRAELSADTTGVMNVHYGDVLVKFGAHINVADNCLPSIINDDLAAKAATNLLQDGDLVIADTAEDDTVGKASEIINCGNRKVVSGLHTIPCRPRRGTYEVGFLGYYINSPAYHNQLRPIMQGIKVTSISRGAIQSETTVDIPCLNEQRKIADFLTAFDVKIEAAQREVEAWETIKKGLMQGLFAR